MRANTDFIITLVLSAPYRHPFAVGEAIMRSVRIATALLLCSPILVSAQSPGGTRPLRVGDMYRLKNVGSPEISPDGKWVAYTVSTTDSVKDKRDTDV